MQTSPEFPPLLDVAAVPVSELMGHANPALTRSLERLVRSLDDPNGVISAFGSFISDN